MNLTESNFPPATRLLQPIITNLYTESDDPLALLVTSQLDTDKTSWPTRLCNELPDNVQWKAVETHSFNEQKFDKQYELAVVIASIDSTYDEITRKSIQLCRDLFGRHTLVIKPVKSQLNLTAFGFSRLTNEVLMLAGEAVEIWQFNLFDYKQLPDWLNSKFWANPENWGKFRW